MFIEVRQMKLLQLSRNISKESPYDRYEDLICIAYCEEWEDSQYMIRICQVLGSTRFKYLGILVSWKLLETNKVKKPHQLIKGIKRMEDSFIFV